MGVAGPIGRLIARIGDAAVRYALPARCPGCGTIVGEDHAFCLPCWQALDFLGRPACGLCGMPLALAFEADARCGACLADPPPYDRVRAAVAYGPTARALALKLKYGRRPGIARTMAKAMRRPGAEMLAGALVAPVPLHRRRIWSRGYNQAALIARALAGDWSDLALDLIERHRPTPLLRGLGRKARARAVTGAFRLNPRWRDAVKGRDVVLVDDVFTTGATAAACARILRRAGARSIGVLCWAQALTGGEGDHRSDLREGAPDAEDRDLYQDVLPLLQPGQAPAGREGRGL